MSLHRIYPTGNIFKEKITINSEIIITTESMYIASYKSIRLDSYIFLVYNYTKLAS